MRLSSGSISWGVPVVVVVNSGSDGQSVSQRPPLSPKPPTQQPSRPRTGHRVAAALLLRLARAEEARERRHHRSGALLHAPRVWYVQVCTNGTNGLRDVRLV